MRQLLLLCCFCLAFPRVPATPDYSIFAIRYADSPGDSVADLVVGAPKDEKIDTIYAIWLIKGGGRNILFDSGFHRERWFKEWPVKNYLGPDEAVKLAGVQPEQITDIVISHAHWDHMGGIDLSQSRCLDSKRGISLLHRRSLAVRRRSRRHRPR